MANTLELKEVLAKGITYEQYRKAVLRGQIIVLRKGIFGTSTLVDANSPYLLSRDRLNQSKAFQ